MKIRVAQFWKVKENDYVKLSGRWSVPCDMKLTGGVCYQFTIVANNDKKFDNSPDYYGELDEPFIKKE